ncbi:glycosyltransferase [Martelella sp. HB161492]|uniref:glycosyltransferase n=1 Tax=Martelella sp. HB161492 TaxID=2720726 RepID=UPI0015924540|nr:glycosyltransferase [Martelella sp. HB161492]
MVELKYPKKYICASIDLGQESSGIENLLNCFREIATSRDDVDFIITGKRSDETTYSIWNYIDAHKLTERIEYTPYYDLCRQFPLKKKAAWRWIGQDAPLSALHADDIVRDDGKFAPRKQKKALFITSFHLERQEGNTTNMRAWLRYLHAAGYQIHVVYYAVDDGIVSPQEELKPMNYCDLYRKVPLRSKMYEINKVGLNIHVDDWCGAELVDAVEEMTQQFEYDVAVVNYPFMSAVFERIPAYTEKILFTHDSFTDRNRRMMKEGFGDQGWASLDWRGEKLACLRSDTVVALQENEASYFKELVGEAAKIPIVRPMLPTWPFVRIPSETGKLRIGYLGSHNWINEANVALFLEAWLKSETLREQSEVILAGGVCDDFENSVAGGAQLLQEAKPVMLGRVGTMADFFARCDVVINPERGGTGIKIKSVEALGSGVPLVCTAAGAAGIETQSRFHNAETIEDLAGLIEELVVKPELVDALRDESVQIYAEYCDKNKLTMFDLFGPVLSDLAAEDASGTEHQPLISIVIPFYNVEPYLEDCLQSVVEQDHRNLEIILVDDASPDRSHEIAERFAKSDPRIKIVTHAKNQGLGPARNSGVAAASGRYLFFLDSDDFFIDKSALTLLTKNARASRADVVVGSCTDVMDDGSRRDRDADFAAGKMNASGGFLKGQEAFRAAVGTSKENYLPMRAWGMLIDLDFYRETGLAYPAGEHEDLCHAPFLYAAANNVLFLTNPIIGYRNRGGSISRSFWSREHVLRYDAMWQRFRSNIARFSLKSLEEECAICLLGHMIWRMESNSCEDSAIDEASRVAINFLSSVSENQNQETFYGFLKWIRDFVSRSGNSNRNLCQLMSGLPAGVANRYYRERIQMLIESA